MRFSYQANPGPAGSMRRSRRSSSWTSSGSGPATARTRPTTRTCGRSLRRPRAAPTEFSMGPEVTHVILKDPTIIAQQAATLDELTQGRAELVYSTGNFAMLRQYGVAFDGMKPIARLREAHHILRTFLARGAIDFQGEFHSYAGLFTAARPVQDPFPIKLGGMRGPRSFELAGEIADGLHTACAYSREALEFTASAFRRGAERSGRNWRDLDLADNPLGAIAIEPEPAREAARIMAAFYIGAMPAELLARHGIDPGDIKPIVDSFTAGDVASVALELSPRARRGAVGSRNGSGLDRKDRERLPPGRLQSPARDVRRSLSRRELVGSEDRRPPQPRGAAADCSTTK